MKKISDTSYRKLFQMKKYKDLCDFSSLECRTAMIASILLIIINGMCSWQLGIDVTTELTVEFLDSISMALIGFIGFSVSALAILTGSISSKVVKNLMDRKKIDSLERIMLSFYLIGLVSALVIVVDFLLHFIVKIPGKSLIYLNLPILFIVSYLIVFIIFYAVKLTGNCIELFYIVNGMQLVEDKKDYKAKYNNYRITALEKVYLGSTSKEKIVEYKSTIKELIMGDDIEKGEREMLLAMLNEHFSASDED